MFLIATLELSYAGVLGCTMLHALFSETGRLNTVTHIWEVPDANTFLEAVADLRSSDDEIGEIFEVLTRSVDKETLMFASALPYASKAPA